jgi:hypothetical protein
VADAKSLRLLAQDAEDLAVISAALQDAVLHVGDIAFEPSARRLTLALNRYRWESGGGERVRAGLQLGGVMQVQTRRVKRGAPEGVLELLAVTFTAGDPPSGVVTFSFAGGADLRATVECVDAVLADLSRPWSSRSQPEHDI